MKICFLDVDGVLVTDERYWQTPTWNLGTIDTLKHILRETGAKIVLSSTWRTRAYLIHAFVEMCNKYNLGKDVIMGMTPDINLFSRDKEITEYLNRLAQSRLLLNIEDYVKSWVVIDDEQSFFQNKVLDINKVVFVDKNKGLTIKEAERVIKILNK
ncbi:MAG: HAD domain-containing protein [Clostridia bacterium]|nr:HAD domain-containing protein [Clostridia bacterium]